MKSKSGNSSLSVNAILFALWQHDESKRFYPKFRDSNLNMPRLNLLIPAYYFESSPAREQFLQKIQETNGLSCLMNAKYAHSGIKADLREISNELLSPTGYNKFLQGTHNDFINEYYKSEQLCTDIPEEIRDHLSKSYEPGSPEDYVIRELQFLYSKKEYGEFFWWLLLKALLQPSANLLLDRMPHNTQYRTIFDWLPSPTKHQFLHSQIAEIEEDHFWNLRQKLIRSARGHLIIAGPSLMDAFNPSAPLNKCVVDSIKEGVNAKQLEKLSIILTDPILFESCESCSQPILDTSWAVTTIEDSLYDLFERNQIELHIYFLPMLQIDHAVITDEFLAMRSTKLWTKEREFKGAFVLYLSDCYIKASSEYRAHKKYLQTIMEYSIEIYPDVDTDTNILGDGSARSRHMQWRKRLRDKNYCISLCISCIINNYLLLFAILGVWEKFYYHALLLILRLKIVKNCLIIETY